MEYKTELTEKYKPTSVNSMLAAVNKFMDFLNLPRFKVKPLKIQRMLFLSEEKELNRNEYFRLIDAARDNGNERLMLIMETIAFMGIRISELNLLRLKPLKQNKPTLTAREKDGSFFCRISFARL